MSILLTPRAEQYAERTAIIASEGSFTYRQLLDASGRVASFLLNGARDLQERPVAFLAPPGFQYVALQWGIWRAGGIAVPLSFSIRGRNWNTSLTTPRPRWSWPIRILSIGSRPSPRSAA